VGECEADWFSRVSGDIDFSPRYFARSGLGNDSNALPTACAVGYEYIASFAG
jgi:hypothetical protein